ncbi:MAG: hypothetical protein U0W24_00905 [Bacteroidales bacterium]
MKKLFFLIFMLAFGFALSIKAQVVNEKPKAPKDTLTKNDVPKPTEASNWVWVPGEWEWKSKSKEYKWVKAHWEKAPENKKYWHQGHWAKVKNGWKWEPGYWE